MLVPLTLAQDNSFSTGQTVQKRGVSWDFICYRWGDGKITREAIAEAVQLARRALLTADSTLRRLRSPLHLKLTASLPVEFVYKAIKSVARYYGTPTDDELQEWYVSEVAGRLAALERLPEPR